jgi:protein-disulfide isomerase
MRLPVFPRSAALLFCLLVSPLWLAACRNDDALSELREQQRLILAKLTALDEKIDKVASRSAAPPRPSGPDASRAYNLPVGTSPSKGPVDAPITIVEFSDYQCPFCARSEPLVKDALAAYPTQARLVYKHYPLTSMHPQALPAALAAAAAQRQGKFWEMHEKLFANQRALAPEQIKQYARELGLDLPKFEADLQSEEVKAMVQQDIQLAQRVGVRGTPTIFVNGKVLQNRSLEGFKQMIDPILKDPAAAQKAGDQAEGS